MNTLLNVHHIFCRFSLAVLPVLLFLASAPPANAELVYGVADISFWGFDFSTQQSVYDSNSPNADLGMVHVVIPPLGYFLYTGTNFSWIRPEPDSTLQDIVWAPAETSAYTYDVVPVTGRSYIVKTADGFYAKFRITNAIDETAPDHAIIEYYVQMDGTQNLDSTLPVQETNWGRLKRLFSDP